MKRISAYRIHCQGLGPVAGLYTSPPPQDHVDKWAKRDVAAFGETSKHGKRWVVKVERESLYVDGACEAHFDDASHPDELRDPPGFSGASGHAGPGGTGEGRTGEIGALGFGTVTNPT